MTMLVSRKLFLVLVVLSHLAVFSAAWAQPDLSPTAITPSPASVVTQHDVEFSWTVENQGTGEAKPNWHDWVYLSADDVVDAEDILLVAVTHTQALAPEGDYSPSRTVTVPNVPAGTYYLIVTIDVYNYLYEADEANPPLSTTIEIHTPDLQAVSITASPLGVTQHDIEVSWTVENQGTGEAKPNWHDWVYLSADDVVDAEDILLVAVAHTQALAPEGDYSPSRTVTVPNVPPGSYYLILVTDLYNYLYEADEGNNLIYETILITDVEGFRIVAIVQMPNGRLRIDFTNIADRPYQLEWCNAMEEASWELEPFYITEDGVETQDTIEGTGAILFIYVTATGDRCFYRMVAQ